MIEKVQIRCFQSINSVDIELGKLTVIVGPTDTGKSAFIRAVRAVVENRRGESFITTGSDGVSVGLVTDKANIVWIKSRKRSGDYYINKAKVPYETAIIALGIAPLEIGRAYRVLPNFQQQLGREQTFLLGETDSVKSKVLGEITNANILFIAGSSIKRKIAENGTVLSVRLRDIEALTAKRESFPAQAVTKVEQDVGVTESKLAVIAVDVLYLQELKAVEAKLVAAVTEVSRLNQAKVKLEPAFAMLPDVENIVNYHRFKMKFVDYEQQIVKLVNDAKVHAKQVKLQNMLPVVDSVEQKIIDLGKLQNYIKAINEVESAKNPSFLSATENKLNEVNQQLAQFNMCPLCERPLHAATSC